MSSTPDNSFNDFTTILLVLWAVGIVLFLTLLYCGVGWVWRFLLDVIAKYFNWD